MRHLLILIVTLMGSSLNAQDNYTITGRILDESGEILSWATVALYQLSDTSLVTGVNSDDLGRFSLTTTTKEALLTVSFIGSGSFSQVLHLEEAVTNLKDIQLSSGVMLNEIEIKAKKLELSYQNGVLSYTPSKVTQSNSLDLLKTVPLIMSDKDDNLLIKGSFAKILINGKDLRLSGEELKSYLQTLPPDQIQKVEVITNPSSKYETEGSSGILNIILKSKAIGFSASVYSNLTYNEQWSGLGGGSFNYFSDRFGLSVSLRHGQHNTLHELSVTKRQENTAKEEMILSDQSNTDTYVNSLSGKVSMNFFLDERNTVSTFFQAYQQKMDLEVNGNSDFFVTPIPATTLLHAQNSFDRQNLLGGLDYQRVIDSSGTSFNLAYLFLHAQRDNQSNQLSKFYENESLEGDFDLQSVNDQTYTIHSFKGDVNLPVNKYITLETGVKYSTMSNQNDLTYTYPVSDQVYILTPIESNNYNYQEDIYAFYLSGQFQVGKVAIQAGNRMEYTDFHTEVNKTDNSETNDDSYFNIFPSIAATYNTSKGNSLSVSYGRRLSRPSYNDLNPSILFITQYIYSQGSPFLKPEYSDNFELGIKSGRLITSLFANFVDQPIGDYITQNNDNNTLLLTKQNLDKSKTIGALVSSSFDLSKKLGLQTTAIGRWQSTSLAENTQTILTAKINANLNYQLTDAIQVTWTADYTAPFLHGLYRVKSQFANNVGLNFQKNNLSLGLSVRDIFRMEIWDSQINADGYITHWVNRWPTGVINLSARYQFGNKKAAAKSRFNGKASNSETDRIN